MVRLVIGEMDLEQMKSLVDGLWQSESLGEPVDGSNTSAIDGVVSVRNVIVDGVCRKDGLLCGGVVEVVESSLDSGLACAEPGAENRFHSKFLVGSGGVGSVYFYKPQKPPRISSFLGITSKDQPEITLGLGLDWGERPFARTVIAL